MKKNRCSCQGQKKVWCNRHSVYKMVFLLRPGYHKMKDTQGNPINPVWYSMFKEERKGPEGVYKMMLARALRSEWATKFYKIQFYRNYGELIKQYER